MPQTHDVTEIALAYFYNILRVSFNILSVKSWHSLVNYARKYNKSFIFSSQIIIFLLCFSKLKDCGNYAFNPLRDNVTRVLHEVFSKNLSSNLDIECFFFVDMKILPFLMKMSKFNELPY